MIDSGEIFNDISISANIGVAPLRSTAFDVATNVISGIINSYPFLIPILRRERYSAEVAFDTAIAYLHPVYSAIFDANFLNFGPSVKWGFFNHDIIDLIFSNNKVITGYNSLKGNKKVAGFKKTLKKILQSENF